MPAKTIEASAPDALATATACLRNDDLVVIPTDTVYGLAAHPDTPDGQAAVYTAKGRPSDKPLPLLIADASVPEKMGATFPETARRLANTFWPGPLTLVLEVGATSEGFRVPDHPFPRQLAAECGGAIRVTSANRSDNPPALNADEARSELGNHVALIVDDGPAKGTVASSVVRVTHERLEVLREGAISMSSLMEVANPEGSTENPS